MENDIHFFKLEDNLRNQTLVFINCPKQGITVFKEIKVAGKKTLIKTKYVLERGEWWLPLK